MPLPPNDIVWPPEWNAPMAAKQAEWDAWYSGDPDRLVDMYGGLGRTTPWWRFWNRARQPGAQRAMLHVPIAADLASVSGALLFGEPPRVRVREEREQETIAEAPTEPGIPEEQLPAPTVRPQTPEARTERRMLDFVEQGGVYDRLIEAAESAAAIGGVYLYPVWDKDLRDFPLLAIAQADSGVPEFRFGILTAVTFHRIVAENGNQVTRHIERHEVEGTGDSRKAVVLHGLYRGTRTMLGERIGLAGSDETAGLRPRVELPFQELDVEYLPNIRPNRLWRASGHGVADIQGAEALLDALDETYASWMRDIRLAKARIIVPREYLRPDAIGNAAFDVDQEVYTPMDMEPGLNQDARMMLAHQFQIRYLEHRETAKELVERIVSNAGYTPTTLGSTGATSTGTALRIGDRRTILTLRRKSSWWRPAIANLLYRMQLIDREVFEQTYTAYKPSITTADSIIDSPLELAQTALALKTAESASIETRVRLIHPDWSNAEVDAEVARIRGDVEAAVTTGRFGAPGTDPASTGNLPTTDQESGPAPTNDPPASPPFAPNAD